MDGTILEKKLKLQEKLAQLNEIAQKVDDMPTFTSNDRAFLEELPGFPVTDGKKVLTATTESGETSLGYEDPEAGVVDYSTTEQATGQKWVDGKEIYFKVVNLAEVLTIQSQTWTDTGVDSSEIDSLIDAKFYDANSVNFAMNVAKMNGETAHITVMQFRSTQVGIIRMVLWYTKTELTKKTRSKK